MLFKFYIKCTRLVPKHFDLGDRIHTYEEEQRAFSNEAIFFDLEKAKAYARLHTATPIIWEVFGGFWSAKQGNIELTIMRDDCLIEPTVPMPMPDNFTSPPEPGLW